MGMNRARSTTFHLSVVGMITSGLSVLVLLLSTRWVFGYVGSKYGFAISNGTVLFGLCESWRSGIGWVFYDPFESNTLGWVPSYAFSRAQSYSLELWKPLVVLAVLTATVWLANRFRYPLSHCQRCGYNLKGNSSGACPECGTPIRNDVPTLDG